MCICVHVYLCLYVYMDAHVLGVFRHLESKCGASIYAPPACFGVCTWGWEVWDYSGCVVGLLMNLYLLTGPAGSSHFPPWGCCSPSTVWSGTSKVALWTFKGTKINGAEKSTERGKKNYQDLNNKCVSTALRKHFLLQASDFLVSTSSPQVQIPSIGCKFKGSLPN